jgi:MbtH protein
MSNPFENPSGTYCVLVNERGQHSLWPDFIRSPPGWTMIGPKGDRDTCIRWVDGNWTDMRADAMRKRDVGDPQASQATTAHRGRSHQ